MGTQGAYGTKVKISVAGVMTTVAHLFDMDPLVLSKLLVDATGHDAPQGYAEHIATGKKSIPSIKLTLIWDDGVNTHQTLAAGFASDEPVDFSVEDPDSTEVIAFKAHIAELGRIYKQNDAYKATITIQPTGAPTIT